jgi:hypothetical protein
VRIRPSNKNEKNTAGYSKNYSVEYIGESIGITWYVRFYEEFSVAMGKYETEHKEIRPYSVRAKINPKILIGIRDYLTAANSGLFDDVEIRFNEEAAKISPLLSKFENYSMNRVDYCINADLVELKAGCSSKQMMNLIKQGDIPTHFTEWTEYNNKAHRKEANKNSLYLQNKSLTINCYQKYEQLIEEFPDCLDIDASLNLIRFEVQCKYPKVYSLAKKNRHKSRVYTSELTEEQIEDMLCGRYNRITNPTDIMLSDTLASDIVYKYFNRVVGKGDYYTLEIAREKVQSANIHPKVKSRLIGALVYVNGCRGISKAKAKLQGEELKQFVLSLKKLGRMGINPVTIPREWGILRIPNLLDAYFDIIADGHAEERLKQKSLEIVEDYIKDCRKQGKSWT